MNYALANQILDRVRGGVAYPEKIITQALEMTGDIYEGLGGSGVADPLQDKSLGAWQGRGCGLVGENNQGHRAHTGQSNC